MSKSPGETNRTYYKAFIITNDNTVKQIPIIYEFKTGTFPHKLQVTKISPLLDKNNQINFQYGNNEDNRNNSSIKKENKKGLDAYYTFLKENKNFNYNTLYAIDDNGGKPNYHYFYPEERLDTHSKIISRFPKDKYNFGLYNSDLTFLNDYSNSGRGFNINKFYSNLDRLIKLKDSFEYEYSNTQDLIELSRKKKDEYDINGMMYPLNSNANDIHIPYSKPNKANPFAKNSNKDIKIKDALALANVKNLELMPPPPPPSRQMNKPPPSIKQLMEDMAAAQQNMKNPNSNPSNEDEYNAAFNFGKIYKLTITENGSNYDYYITLRQNIIFSEKEAIEKNKKYPNITLDLDNRIKKDSGLFIRNKRISGLDDKTIINMIINHHKQKTGGRKMYSRKKNKKHMVSKRKSRKYIQG